MDYSQKESRDVSPISRDGLYGPLVGKNDDFHLIEHLSYSRNISHVIGSGDWVR